MTVAGRRIVSAALGIVGIASAIAVMPRLGARTAPLRQRLERWYDRIDGLGAPCAPRATRPYAGPGGLVLDIPVCWETRLERRDGAWVHLLGDPGLGIDPIVLTAARPDGGERWLEMERKFAVRATIPGRAMFDTGRFIVVANSYSTTDPMRPYQYFHWLGRGDDLAFEIGYRVPKIFLRSPQLDLEMATLGRAIAGARADPAAEPGCD